MDNSAVLSLFAPPKLYGIKKLLCVQPHPDDNEIGMGGIISLLTKKGVQVDYLTVTDGSLGDIGIPYGEESAMMQSPLLILGIIMKLIMTTLLQVRLLQRLLFLVI